MSVYLDPVDFTIDAPVQAIDVSWIHGSESAKHNDDPDIQVHEYDEHTYLLRQNMAVNYEGPFLFLLFGNDRAVLIDSGATASADYFPLRRVVDDLINGWLSTHPRPGYGLLVVHTHAHGDHIAGDSQFKDRGDTVVVNAERPEAWAFFGFDADASRTAQIDAGGRILHCLATPGHHRAAVTFYDPYTGLLFTGDTVYRGRLYVEDWAAFSDSLDRLIEFAATHRVSHVLGCHIEMTTQPGVDYPVRTTYQPDEPPLQMTADHLRRVRAALLHITERGGSHRFGDFIIEYDNSDD